MAVLQVLVGEVEVRRRNLTKVMKVRKPLKKLKPQAWPRKVKDRVLKLKKAL